MMMRVRNLLSSVVVSEEARAEVCRVIQDNAQLDLRFVFMNGLAAVIASYGLLAGSTATVIGAMVIATLLGAISGIALALVHQLTDTAAEVTAGGRAASPMRATARWKWFAPVGRSTL